ncbi:UNVERIFIED_CONTAM: hypothetical protein NCL1_27771 [Trichonephila clavipes]
MNGKIAQFCVTVKKRTEVVPPPSPRIVAMVRRGSKGGAETPLRKPKSNAQRGKEFRERKKKLAASPVEKVTKKQKNSANSSSATAKSRSEYMRECQAREKTSQNTLLMPSLRDGNAIENFLMTAQINTDFVNPFPVPSTSDLSTSLVRVGTDACESIINSLQRQLL